MIINMSLKKKERKKKKKKDNRLVKSLMKRNHLKNQQNMIGLSLMNGLMKKEKDINSELFQEHFRHQEPSNMLRDLYRINNKKKNNELVNLIKSGLNDLKNEIENMDEEEKEIEKSSAIVNIVEEILEFNKQKQEGKGLKILTPDQMLSRLPITLAQLKAGNNSEKLKNEIRQLLYSLYRSKKLTKQLYKSLVDII